MKLKTQNANNKTAFEIRNSFLNGDLTCLEITEENLKRIRDVEPEIGAFITVTEEDALSRAKDVDQKLANGEKMGALAGIPVAVKDNLCTRGVKTTCGSRMLENFIPPYSAHVIEKLLEEDAVIVGKTNMDEFAMGSSTENSAFKLTRNPWDTERVPGGSSGGSAAAVASGMVPLALGSDTAGSIRQPAALCGVMGLKPTYGRVSRHGVVAFASSMDQVGPVARNPLDMALLLGAIAAPDERDSTCTRRPVPDYIASLDQPLGGFKFGMPAEFFDNQGLSDAVRNSLQEARKELEGLGAEFQEISLPHSRIDSDGDTVSSFAIACYYILATAEAASNLARFDGVRYGTRPEEIHNMEDVYRKSRGEGFGAEVKRRIMLGTHALSSGYYDAYYQKAGKVRRLICEDFDKAFGEVDLIFAPTTPTPAFKIGEKTADPLEMYLSDIFTSSSNLAGNCSISIPCGHTPENLPVGFQLIGRRWDESRLLAAAKAFQTNAKERNIQLNSPHKG